MIVIDASVGLKWLRRENEKHIDEALLLLKNHSDDVENIVVPSLFYLEIANALVTKSKTKAGTIKENLSFLNDINLKVDSFTKTDYIEASLLAKRYKTTVYDMLYAVIARKLNTILITADDKFIKKTKFKFVKFLSEYQV